MGIFDDDDVDIDEFLDDEEVEEEGGEEYEEEEAALSEAVEEVDNGPEPQETSANQTIPLQELLYERRRRQELEKKLDDQGSNLALINQRLQSSMQRQQQEEARLRQQQEAAERPDEDDDPLGHANWRINQVERQLKGLGTMARQGVDLHRSLVQQNEQQSIVQQSQSLQDRFARDNPDYWDAYNFLIGTRRQELQAMGYDQQAADQVIDNEKSMIVQNAMSTGQDGKFAGWQNNPAQVVYELAKQRGYAAGGAPQAAVNPAAQQRVNRLAAGVRSATGTGGGRSTGGAPASLESLAEMTDAEFDRFRRQNPGMLESMLGG